MRCKDCPEVRRYPYKRSHLVALRPNKIPASDPPSTWWQASDDTNGGAPKPAPGQLRQNERANRAGLKARNQMFPFELLTKRDWLLVAVFVMVLSGLLYLGIWLIMVE
jgi:hypothetical protein